MGSQVIAKFTIKDSKGNIVKIQEENKEIKQNNNLLKDNCKKIIKNLFKENKVNNKKNKINDKQSNNPKNIKSNKQIELENKIKKQDSNTNKLQTCTKKFKEDIKLAQKRTEFLNNWEKTMTYTGLFNEMHETFSPNDLKFTKYGAEARLYIPWGYNYKHLKNVRETLQNNLCCTVILISYVDKNYVDAKFIYIENCNKIKFKPVPAKPYELFLGVDESGKPIMVDVNSEPHVLVAGATRSGKNGTLDHIIANLIYNCTDKEINLYLLQGAKGDLAKYRNCKQVKEFAFCDDEDILIQIIKNIYNEMKKRRKLFLDSLISNFKDPNIKDYNKKFPNKKLPYIYIIVDEIMAVISKVDANKKNCQFQIVDLLQKIAEYGGAYGISYVVSHQKPEAKLMPTFLKNMSNVRVCFGFNDSICSAIVLGDGRYEAVGLPPRKAYVICKVYEGYLYTLDLEDNIYKYVKDSIIEKPKTNESNNSNNSNNSNKVDKSSNKQIKTNNSKDNIIDIGIKQLQKQNKDSKSLEIIDNKPIINIQKQIKPKENYIKNDFQKVHPKTKEETLLDNISKIDGYVPYVPPKSKE